MHFIFDFIISILCSCHVILLLSFTYIIASYIVSFALQGKSSLSQTICTSSMFTVTAFGLFLCAGVQNEPTQGVLGGQNNFPTGYDPLR